MFCPLMPPLVLRQLDQSPHPHNDAYPNSRRTESKPPLFIPVNKCAYIVHQYKSGYRIRYVEEHSNRKVRGANSSFLKQFMLHTFGRFGVRLNFVGSWCWLGLCMCNQGINDMVIWLLGIFNFLYLFVYSNLSRCTFMS